MSEKVLDVILFKRNRGSTDRQYECSDTVLDGLIAELKVELAAFGIKLRVIEKDRPVEIKGYGDLLNSMRISYPAGGVSSLCLGHIIGTSPNLNIVEDLRRGINRVAFAPETVEPQGSDKVVCHNCGCGC